MHDDEGPKGVPLGAPVQMPIPPSGPRRSRNLRTGSTKGGCPFNPRAAAPKRCECVEQGFGRCMRAWVHLPADNDANSPGDTQQRTHPSVAIPKDGHIGD